MISISILHGGMLPSEKSGDVPKITQLVSGRVGVLSQALYFEAYAALNHLASYSLSVSACLGDSLAALPSLEPWPSLILLITMRLNARSQRWQNGL